MSVVVIGVNNRTMPLDLFERMTVSGDRLPKALADVCSRRHVSEAVLLSTCNRTEMYVYAEKFHGAYQDVRDFLAEFAQLAPEDFADHVYARYDDEAVRHLFSVTAGLESAVLGESEIQGQVKSSWETALAEGAAGTTLNAVFRHALEVGKRVRTETAVSRNITSVAHAAVVMADTHLGGLAGRRVLVLGAGDMGKGMATMLANARLERIVFANRSIDRAQGLASEFGNGEAIGLEDLAATLDRVDVLLTSTGAQSLMVDGAELESVMERRQGQPLLIVDIAVPRDVDPSVAGLEAVTLLDMDDLSEFTQEGRREREAEIGSALRVIDAELERFSSAQSARQAAPLVASFRQNAEAIRVGELDRFSARLADLDDDQREVVDELTRAILGKIMHEPSVQLSDAAGTPRGDRLAEALRDLFQL